MSISNKLRERERESTSVGVGACHLVRAERERERGRQRLLFSTGDIQQPELILVSLSLSLMEDYDRRKGLLEDYEKNHCWCNNSQR